MTRALIEAEAPEVVVVATGGKPRRPVLPGTDMAHVVDAWQVLKGEANVGASVVIADWRADWIGLWTRSRRTVEQVLAKLRSVPFYGKHEVAVRGTFHL